MTYTYTQLSPWATASNHLPFFREGIWKRCPLSFFSTPIIFRSFSPSAVFVKSEYLCTWVNLLDLSEDLLQHIRVLTRLPSKGVSSTTPTLL